MTITIFKAKRIITMDKNNRSATHVAVRDGHVLAVGDETVADIWGGGEVDERFAHMILMPGFVEGHAHLMAGAMWNYTYAGYHERIDPEGEVWSGATTIQDVVKRLKQADRDLPDGEPLIAWGFDPIFLTTERLNCHHLDQVSAERPIAVIHSNFHLMTVNSKSLEMVSYTRESNAEGIAKDQSGNPNGELQEMAAMFPVLRRLSVDFRELARTETGMRNFAKTATLAGVTTSADLFNDLPEEDVETLLKVSGEDDFALRIVPALNALSDTPENVTNRARSLKARSSDRLRLGAVKVMTDGSIQGYTGRIKWPGYVTGHENGIWNTPPEQLMGLVETLHASGVQMHIHTNGDEASEVAIDAIERALNKHPRGDHRHTLQHCQMADEAQFAKMSALGICVNLFANHLWYFGDQHHDLTIGPDKANRMDASRSALDHGVPLAIHSDAPVTPMAPLFTAWCAVNRLTPSGRTLGAAQCISVAEALEAITLGAAYTLRLDHEIGSIETGKRADFAVLDRDPETVEPTDLRDIRVLGTVMGGRTFMNPGV